jgi:uncharacterized surface protein with fasciclin (FAS1) repeats
MMMRTQTLLFQALFGFLVVSTSKAFVCRQTTTSVSCSRSSGDVNDNQAGHSALHATDTVAVEAYLADRYPLFMSTILGKNDAVWKKLRETDQGYTIFAPTDAALNELGGNRLQQLQDIRNIETAAKMCAYHAVIEPVTADELFASGGIITVGGDVPVGRSITGGIFGMGGKEDGGVTVNGAKVLQTTQVENCIIHETDSLISPQILWRYCDQLRIPGSK